MSIRQGKKLIASSTTNGFNLFDCKWADHILNNISWLRADTFSWQSGDVYAAAYNHLVADVKNIIEYMWTGWESGRFYSTKSIPSVGDTVWGGDYTVGEVGSDYIVLYRNGVVYERANLSAVTYTTSQTDTIGDITITYALSDDGHKICLPNQESNIAALYEATGVAWYYILDTTNRQFKLPRTKWGFTGIRSGVGGYIAPGLPNITGTYDGVVYLSSYHSTSVPMRGTGALYTAKNSSGTMHITSSQGANRTTKVIGLDASRSNAIYGNSDTVQPPATQMYLYFYVGNFVEDITTIDAGKLAEVVNDFDIDTFKPQVDEAKNSAISDINEATSNSVEQLKNMGEVVNYTNITNCITEIPQDIKLELNNGTLTLKAGSKVCVPNGVGVFDITTTQSDNVLSGGLATGRELVYLTIDGILIHYLDNSSGSDWNATSQYQCRYNTSANMIKNTNNTGSTWETQVSFPLAIITLNNGVVQSIDQVFNGFGYIGSTVFALPGVKGLIPNGRNPDGTLNNIKCTTSQVATLTVNGNRRLHVAIRDNGTLGWWNTSGTRYDANQNFNYYNDFIQYCAVVGKFDVSNGQIQNFRPYNTFHAVDYNSGDYVIDFQDPTSANGTWYRKYKSGWVEQGGFLSGEPRTATLPVAMADTNYSVVCVQRGTTAPTAPEGSPRAGAISTTQIYVNGGASPNDVCWQVSGYAA